jgi:hypothetical protein
MWGGFAIFWEVMVFRQRAPLLFQLWGMPFVAMGLHLIAGRFFVDRARRARTYYGLTSERALIVRAGRVRSVTSIDLGAQPSFDLVESGSGRGTITLGPVQAWNAAVPGWSRSRALPPSFEGIENARVVYDKLCEAQRAIRDPAAARDRVRPLLLGR